MAGKWWLGGVVEEGMFRKWCLGGGGDVRSAVALGGCRVRASQRCRAVGVSARALCTASGLGGAVAAGCCKNRAMGG